MVIFWNIPKNVKSSTVEEWAKKIGFSVIDFRLQEDGFIYYKLQKNKAGQPRKKITKMMIESEMKNGKSIAQIARENHVCRATIYKYLKKTED